MPEDIIAKHYGQLIGLRPPWQVSQVEVCHTDQEVRIFVYLDHSRRSSFLGDLVLDRALGDDAGSFLPACFSPRFTVRELVEHFERIETARRASIERSLDQVRWFRRIAAGNPGPG